MSVNVCTAPGQVNDELTLQRTAGEQTSSIHQQRQPTTNHTAGWSKDLPSFQLDTQTQTLYERGSQI